MEDLADAAPAGAPAGPDGPLVTKFESFARALRPATGRGRPDAHAAKLYQPAHGRFYLVAASLVCRLPGLPDHVVDPRTGEKVGFVLRKLGRAARRARGCRRHGPEGQARLEGAHRRAGGHVGEAARSCCPLFPVNFTADGKRRRMLVGLMPTSSREPSSAADAFQAPASEQNPQEMIDGRGRGPVLVPLEQLLAWNKSTGRGGWRRREESSRFLLVDFADASWRPGSRRCGTSSSTQRARAGGGPRHPAACSTC